MQPNTTIVSEGSQTHNDRHVKTPTTRPSFCSVLILPFAALKREDTLLSFKGLLQVFFARARVRMVVTAFTLFDWSCKPRLCVFISHSQKVPHITY